MITESEQEALILQYCETKDERLKTKALEAYKPLVEYIARKFAYNRNDVSDLVQVGLIATLKCLDRFDPTMNVHFSSFITPSIIGEIKHYFRDKSRLIKVPRKLQELHHKIKTEIRKASSSGETLVLSTLAKRLNVDEELVLEAMEAGQNVKTLSLDSPVFGQESPTVSKQHSSLMEKLGSASIEDTFINKHILEKALSQLKERERRIVYLRFYEGLSQSDISKRMGLSQMHISRLLAQSIKQLRQILVQDND